MADAGRNIEETRVPDSGSRQGDTFERTKPLVENSRDLFPSAALLHSHHERVTVAPVFAAS